MAVESNPKNEKLCMGYQFGFCYPDCTHCECFITCFRDAMEYDVSSRDLDEQ